MDNKENKMKKPKFKRQQAILKKLKNRWRRPKGIQSKLRLRKGGKGKVPRVGYGSNRISRGNIKGKSFVHISNLNELENMKQPIIISSKIGLKKKLKIINKAKELKIEILNVKDVEKFLKEVKEKQDSKKKLREEKSKKRVRKEEKAKKDLEKDEKENKDDKEKKLKEEKKKVLEKGL